jgi:hypothetical protein
VSYEVASSLSENGVRLRPKMGVGACIPVGIQLEKAKVGLTSRLTWRLSHFARRKDYRGAGRIRVIAHHAKRRHLGVDAKVIVTPPFIFCMENHLYTGWCTNDVKVQG